MFWMKSNITNQAKMKKQLLVDMNAMLYQLEKRKYNNALDKSSMELLIKDLRAAYVSVENSIGTGDEDISLGCSKVRVDIEHLNKAVKGNLIGRVEDSALSLIEDLKEIIDLENGLITSITPLVDSSSNKQKQYFAKLKEIENIAEEFVKHRNRVEEDIKKIERDKAELDQKMLDEGNPRLKQNLFRQIKATISNIATLHVKSDQYSSCFNLIDSIKIYTKELVEMGDLSAVELDKAKIILNINRIRLVLDDPSKLEPLLRVIDTDLKKTREKTKLRDQGIERANESTTESYDEMMAYQNQLIQQRTAQANIANDVKDLEENLSKTKDR